MKKKPFRPMKLPVQLSDKDIIEILHLEADVRAGIQEFNSILERSVLKEELLMMFSLVESVQSTKIEGTQASFSEVLESEIKGSENKDVREVKNYFEGLKKGRELLKNIPISTRMILQIHEIILKGSRGQDRNPGNYRQIQNFIGPTNKIDDATYIPPEANLIPEYMSNLENYINEVDGFTDKLGYISKAAIVHGQFESIHPFLDGNGRVGRVLIILYLLDKNIISSPTFFVSEELEKNKHKYYTLLNNLRTEDPKWKDWIIFFLKSSVSQAEKYTEKLKKVEYFYEDLLKVSKDNRISGEVALFILSNPIFNVKLLEERLDISYNTARKYVKIFEENGKIYGNDKKRNRSYYNYDLLNILD